MRNREEGGGEHSNSNVASKNVRAQLPTLAMARVSPVSGSERFPTVVARPMNAQL